MRQRFLDLLVGLAVGGLVGGSLISVRWQDLMGHTYLVHTADQATVLLALARGEAELVRQRIQKALPIYVETIEQQFSQRPERCWVLWQVRKAYEAAGESFPESIRPALVGLPPESSCVAPAPAAEAPASTASVR